MNANSTLTPVLKSPSPNRALNQKKNPMLHLDVENQIKEEFEYNEVDDYSLYEDPKTSNNMSTLSPIKNQQLKEEPIRKLESQPIQMNVNPLYLNRDQMRKHRFGRPNTNSPFPNMDSNIKQKKQKKGNKSGFNHPPTATSTQNQPYSDNQSITMLNNQLDSGLGQLKSSKLTYVLPQSNILNQYFDDKDNKQLLNFDESYQSNKNNPQIVFSNLSEYDMRTEILSGSQQVREIFNPNQIKLTPLIVNDTKKKPKKYKYQTEPNSPKVIYEDQGKPLRNNQKLDQTEVQVRPKVKKTSFHKYSQDKVKSKPNQDIESYIMTPHSEQQSKNYFLPQLEKTGRDLSIQLDKQDIKFDKVEIGTKSPTNTWAREGNNKKISNSQDRNGKQMTFVNPNALDFKKVFTPLKNHFTSKYSVNQPKFVFTNQPNSSILDHSPDFKNQKFGLQEYFQTKNIGKIQPEFKHINENLI